MATNGKDILSQITNIKNKDDNSSLLGNKGTLTSAVIGAGVGLYIGYSRHYNLLVSAMLGAALAGVVSNLLINRNTQTES